MSAWLSLTILMVVIFHICTTATESISSLDTMAIYDGLLAPENIIGTNLQHQSNKETGTAMYYKNDRQTFKKNPQNLVNLNFEEKNPQNLVNFVASVVGWALLVPLYQPQERTGRDRVRRSTSTKEHHSMVEEENRVEETELRDNDEEEEMEELFSNKFPSAHTIATVLRSIADAADLYGS